MGKPAQPHPVVGRAVGFTPAAFVFRPSRSGRIGRALLLILWLCAWLAATALAAFLLGDGGWSLVTGRPSLAFGAPLQLGPALGVGAFLLFWLAIWLFGGLLVIRHLLRVVWSTDRLEPTPDGLLWERRVGPLSHRQHLTRQEVRRVFIQPATTALMVDLGGQVRELTDLGTLAQRSEAAARLQAALGLPEHPAPSADAELPAGWQQAIGPRGECLLIPDPRTRRQQAVVVGIITAVVWAILLPMVAGSLRDPPLWGLTLMMAVVGAWLAGQTLWLSRGRNEWRIEPGKLVQQRRFGAAATPQVEAGELELVEDNDVGSLYELRAIQLTPPRLARQRKLPRWLPLERSTTDATAPRMLGQWLASRAGIPLHDRIPDLAERQAEIARLKEQLAATGALGRMAVRALDRADRERES